MYYNEMKQQQQRIYILLKKEVRNYGRNVHAISLVIDVMHTWLAISSSDLPSFLSLFWRRFTSAFRFSEEISSLLLCLQQFDKS